MFVKPLASRFEGWLDDSPLLVLFHKRALQCKRRGSITVRSGTPLRVFIGRVLSRKILTGEHSTDRSKGRNKDVGLT